MDTAVYPSPRKFEAIVVVCSRRQVILKVIHVSWVMDPIFIQRAIWVTCVQICRKLAVNRPPLSRRVEIKLQRRPVDGRLMTGDSVYPLVIFVLRFFCCSTDKTADSTPSPRRRLHLTEGIVLEREKSRRARTVRIVFDDEFVASGTQHFVGMVG